MNLSREERKLISMLNNGTLTKHEVATIDGALYWLEAVAKEHGIVVENDTNLSALEAALVKFILTTRKGE